MHLQVADLGLLSTPKLPAMPQMFVRYCTRRGRQTSKNSERGQPNHFHSYKLAVGQNNRTDIKERNRNAGVP